MSPQQLADYYSKNPTHHPDHLEQIAAKNGLEIIGAGTAFAGGLSLAGGLLRLFATQAPKAASLEATSLLSAARKGTANIPMRSAPAPALASTYASNPAPHYARDVMPDNIAAKIKDARAAYKEAKEILSRRNESYEEAYAKHQKLIKNQPAEAEDFYPEVLLSFQKLKEAEIKRTSIRSILGDLKAEFLVIKPTSAVYPRPLVERM